MYSGIEANLWKVDEDNGDAPPKLVDGLAVGWQREGYLRPLKVVPGDYWPGWGEGVSWVEMKGFSYVEGREIDREFFVDDFTVVFYPLA